ncbi:hypothetical protein B0A55_10576 [Friedmanniomyces simplex]|uniref:Uncharacterized protein n=1 Tax=Friedmanniomyces simplex TaxID=329884 RepID=A0A4U0WS70_9PEZI|nr:hypothetical protein B0A55_10576 [Friedmanniomyces simplex]
MATPTTTSTYKIKWDSKPVEIQDARGREQEFDMDKNGFEFHSAPVSLDFEDEEAVKGIYYREVEKLALKLTGADRAHVVNRIKRTTYAGDTSVDKATAPVPATMLHVDYSYDGAWELFDKEENRGGLMIPKWDTLKKTHRAALNLLSLREIRITHRNGASHEMWHLAYDPKQTFYHKSRTEPDDVLVAKLLDSKKDGRARGTPHTGFQTENNEGPPRDSIETSYSIETRCLVFWENESLD